MPSRSSAGAIVLSAIARLVSVEDLGDDSALLANCGTNSSGDIIRTAFSEWSKKICLFSCESLAALAEERQVASDGHIVSVWFHMCYANLQLVLLCSVKSESYNSDLLLYSSSGGQ